MDSATDGETWRPHPELIGVRVSASGRVQTRWRQVGPGRPNGESMQLTESWRECGVYNNPQGYRHVCLFSVRKGDEQRRRRGHFVHRLLMAAFVGPCPPGMCVCHCNGVKTDNRLENLRYDTPKGNSADSRKHGAQAIGSRHGIAKLTEAKVKVILGRLAKGDAVTAIAADYKVSHATISYIRDEKTWTHVPRPPVSSRPSGPDAVWWQLRGEVASHPLLVLPRRPIS